MDRDRAGLTVRRARWHLSAALAAVLLLTVTACAPAGVRELAGDLAAHDPALVAGSGDDRWFVYSTGDPLRDGGDIQIRESIDGGTTWRYAGPIWDERPAWIGETVRGVTNLWAPELLEHDGTWYLYYAASMFGSNHSAIGLATNTTLDPGDPAFEWVDRGPVLVSKTSDDFNAIDPGVVMDAAGSPWMAFGSFWSGIRMVPLEWPSGLRADAAEPLRLAGGREGPNAIEAPIVVPHDDAYYLFVSIGACCQGVDSTYQIAVGRSDSVTGPYLDEAGVPMVEGGGTVLISSEGHRIGPGGQSFSNGLLGFHYYDAELDGDFQLAIASIDWGGDGWPRLHW
jgi:arabinan endo-1,5-alpha-L-arabinosidase